MCIAIFHLVWVHLGRGLVDVPRGGQQVVSELAQVAFAGLWARVLAPPRKGRLRQSKEKLSNLDDIFAGKKLTPSKSKNTRVLSISEYGTIIACVCVCEDLCIAPT